MRTLATLFSAVLLVLMASGMAQAQYVMDVGQIRVALMKGELGESEKLHQATAFYVAKLTNIAGTRGSKSLDAIIARRQRHIFYMRNIVRQNREAMRVLEINHATLEQVILFATSSRTVMMYVDDRQEAQ